MRTVILTIGCVMLCGCKSGESMRTQDSAILAVSRNEVIGLPQDLTFGELQRRLGRALTADPYFIYRLDGTNELVTIEMEAPRGSGGSRITGIYLVDDTFTQRLARLWPASSPE